MRTVADSCCFPASMPTVSLQQMIKFGAVPSQGTLLKASQFLTEEVRPSSDVFDPSQSLADGYELGLLSLFTAPRSIGAQSPRPRRAPRGAQQHAQHQPCQGVVRGEFRREFLLFLRRAVGTLLGRLVFCGGTFQVEL